MSRGAPNEVDSIVHPRVGWDGGVFAPPSRPRQIENENTAVNRVRSMYAFSLADEGSVSAIFGGISLKRHLLAGISTPLFVAFIAGIGIGGIWNNLRRG